MQQPGIDIHCWDLKCRHVTDCRYRASLPEDCQQQHSGSVNIANHAAAQADEQLKVAAPIPARFEMAPPLPCLPNVIAGPNSTLHISESNPTTTTVHAPIDTPKTATGSLAALLSYGLENLTPRARVSPIGTAALASPAARHFAIQYETIRNATRSIADQGFVVVVPYSFFPQRARIASSHTFPGTGCSPPNTRGTRRIARFHWLL